MQVLIVEHDAALGQFLAHGVKAGGHAVTVLSDPESGIEAARRLRPEVMILDLGQPQKDGLDMLAELADCYPTMSMLVLTGRTAMEDRVRCLEAGADDVVQKPFSFHEVRARLMALCRRRGRFEETRLRFGEIEMDRMERRVTQAGREIELTATEFLLLESLLRRRGEHVCRREELLREVWRSPKDMGTNIVEVYINYLRKKLRVGKGRNAGFESVIRTVRGEGYVLQMRPELEHMPATDNAVWGRQDKLERKAG